MQKLETVTLQHVKEIAEKHFCQKCNEIKQLSGYCTNNYWLKSVSSKKEFVMRVQPEKYCLPAGAYDEIHYVIEHLFANGFDVPRVLNTRGNSCFVVCDIKDKSNDTNLLTIQVSHFIRGKTIQESNFNAEQLTDVSTDVGRYVGLLSQSLLECPVSKKGRRSFRDNDHVWYTENYYALKNFLHYVNDVELKEIIATSLTHTKKTILPLLPLLRKGYVHGDSSNSNIVVKNDVKENAPVKDRFGIIDFEDCHYGPVVFDLTVCMAYMMVNGLSIVSDPIALAGSVLSGYQEVLPLTDVEERVLFLGVMARLATSYVMSFERLDDDHADKEYVFMQSGKCPPLLKLMWEKGESETLKFWMK